MTKKNPKTTPVPDDDKRPDKGVDEVAEASIESFPASDPPSFNPGVAAPKPAEEAEADKPARSVQKHAPSPPKPVR